MSHLSNLLVKLKESDAQAILVTSEVSQQYLTGFDFSDGYVLVTLNKSYLLTDFRYIEAARAAVGEEFEVLMPEVGALKKAGELIRENGVTTLLIEEATLSCLACERIKSIVGEGVTVKNGASALIDTLRLYKDEGELAAMQKAQNIADAAFAHILDNSFYDRSSCTIVTDLVAIATPHARALARTQQNRRSLSFFLHHSTPS